VDPSRLIFHRPPRGILWRDWGVAAFDAARAAGRPVLLLVTTPWSEACATLERMLAEDGPAAEIVAAEYVAVRVDAERRPDISDRYDAGGWPTLACLTADAEVVSATTDVFDDLIRVLRRLQSPARLPPQETAHDAGDEGFDARAWFSSLARTQFDDEYGGFGRGSKVPHAETLHALLPDPSAREIVVRSLDALRALHDPDDGGICRFAASRDWSDVAPEKLLADQATVLDLYVAAAGTLREPAYLADAAAIVQFVTTKLADPAGGFAGSVCGDQVDATCYVAGNARMTGALLQVALASRDEALARAAVSGLERIVLATYRPAQGVAHWMANGCAGDERLLIDQVSVASAMLDAHDIGGDGTHLMMAEELMLTATRTLWDEPTRAFRDRVARPDDVAPLGTARYPLEANSSAALVLARLADRAAKPEYRARAVDVLRALAPAARAHGLLAAPYVSAVELIC
jgi:uncharacterized protein YyaL (SSP411 family)